MKLGKVDFSRRRIRVIKPLVDIAFGIGNDDVGSRFAGDGVNNCRRRPDAGTITQRYKTKAK